MSDQHEVHESPIKTPKQLITVVVAAFLVPIIVILLLVKFVNSEPRTGAGTDALTPEATAARIAPIAKFDALPAAAAPTEAPAAPVAAPSPPQAVPATVAAIAAANASAASAAAITDPGTKLYSTVCVACHAQGVAGAPKFGDKAAWAPRIAEGLPTLFEHALKGFQGKSGVMPPRGGSSASDGDVEAAVRHMVDAAK